MELIDSGAEASIYKDDEMIIKKRKEKDYRLKQIDERLRKARTRRETKVIQRLNDIGFPTSKLIDSDDKEMTISMQFIKGEKLRDVLYKDPLGLGREVGKKIGTLHKNGIIHSDLTTSNMILENEIKFIDFGLSFFSAKTEDKATDLNLMRKALESKHHTNWEQCFIKVLEGYKEVYPDYKDVLKRLEKVESRGRNKNKH